MSITFQSSPVAVAESQEVVVQAQPTELEKLFLNRKTQWASEIIKGQLWLGSGTNASDLEALKSRNIYDVLNVADDVPNFHEADESFRYLKLDVQDFGCDAGISRVFDKAFGFLQRAKDENKRVLVHCAAGANRSATIVIAWLMHSKQITLAEAWKEIKSKRRGVVPLKDNRLELLNFERSMFKGASSFEKDEDFLSSR